MHYRCKDVRGWLWMHLNPRYMLYFIYLWESLWYQPDTKHTNRSLQHQTYLLLRIATAFTHWIYWLLLLKHYLNVPSRKYTYIQYRDRAVSHIRFTTSICCYHSALIPKLLVLMNNLVSVLSLKMSANKAIMFFPHLIQPWAWLKRCQYQNVLPIVLNQTTEIQM